MQKQSIKENLIFQGVYQLLILAAPLIVSPYLTRTLGADSLGVYSFSNSIAYYFLIFAMLGIMRHGQREIASNTNDIIKLRTTFWSLYVLHAAFSFMACLAYIFYVIVFVDSNTTVFWAQGFYVVSALFDITWFYYGIEQFKSVAIKNAGIKVMELTLIFTCINSSEDLLKYTLIMTVSICLGQIVMIPQAIKLVPPIRISKIDIIKNIKPLFILGISVVAVTLYTVFDKTLLGVMLNMSSVSFYEYSNKIVSVPKSILGVISTVLFPRVCSLVDANDENGLRGYFSDSLFWTSLFGFCFMAVLAGVAKTFAPLYFGESFSICGDVILVMSPVIVIVAIGDLIRTQLMISKHKDNLFIWCLIANAIVNIILSIILIKPLGLFGAVVGSLSAELCGLVLEAYCCREDIVLKDFIMNIIPFGVIGVITYFVMTVIYIKSDISFLSLGLETIIGLLTYLILSLLYSLLFEKDKLSKIIKL